MDKNQKFDINLMEIVPEYYSGNQLVRDLFLNRLRVAINYIKKIKTKKLLDAGCGDGLLLMNLNKNKSTVKEMTGIDMNDYVEDLNRTYTFARFMKQDITKMPFNRNSFDTITCLDVLEHFEDLDKPLNEIKRVLTKNGYLIVSGPVESFWYKLLRFCIKGKFSGETGPGAGKHYRNIKEIDTHLIEQYDFERVERTKIKFLFIHLFDVNLYKV